MLEGLGELRLCNLFATALVIVLSFGTTGCKQAVSSTPSAPPPEVGVAPVTTKRVRAANEFNGRVEAIEAVEIRARVTGYVEQVSYREGADVQRGDLLFVIDPRPYRNVLANAQAALVRARAAEQFARLQAERAETLRKDEAVSHEELQNRQSDLAQSIAGVQEAQANVANAELNLGFTEVRAPITGRTSRALLTRGNLAQADQTMLTTMMSQNPIYVYFDCDEQSYLRYQKQARHGERVSSANPVRVGLATETGFPHSGKINFLNNEVNSSTGTIRARVILANADRTFVPGLFARVRLGDTTENEALLIDDKAVLTDQDHRYVYVLGEGNKAIRRDVTLGHTVDDLRVVESGLRAGEKVIVSGLQKIFFTGAPVTPKAMADAPPNGQMQPQAN